MSETAAIDEPGAFWSDNFDMDLFKALPAAREWIAPIKDLPLYTYGRVTNGRLNHPAVWNQGEGMASFWGTSPSGFKPSGFVSGNDQIVTTNGEDAIRDLWVHNCIMILDGHQVWNSEVIWPHFEAMMWRTRGWGDGNVLPRIPQDDCEHFCEVSIKSAVGRICAVAGIHT